MLSRRGLIAGLTSLIAAPAIVRAANIMPVKALPPVLLRADPAAIMASNMFCTSAVMPEMFTVDFATILQLKLQYRQNMQRLLSA